MKNSNSKLGSIQLYAPTPISNKEQQIIQNYKKILWYAKQQEKDLYARHNNGGVNSRGERIDYNQLIHEKLINLEMFCNNAINNDFWLGMEKLNNKKNLLNGAVLQMSSQYMLDGMYWPLEYVNREYLHNQKQYIKKAYKEYMELDAKYINVGGKAYKTKRDSVKTKLKKIYQ